MEGDRRGGHHTGCLLCGRPLVYSLAPAPTPCALCGRTFSAHARCESGHYICDPCHTGSGAQVLALLRGADEKDPHALFERVAALPGVHMHGPEYHSIVPCVLLTTCRNCGGGFDLPPALATAWRRGAQMPGGMCGFWGACGAAVGAGIYASLLTAATPLQAEAWGPLQQLTARCLERITRLGGPRCCKRTARVAIEQAAWFTETHMGIPMPVSAGGCGYIRHNSECIRGRCPYYGV